MGFCQALAIALVSVLREDLHDHGDHGRLPGQAEAIEELAQSHNQSRELGGTPRYDSIDGGLASK